MDTEAFTFATIPPARRGVCLGVTSTGAGTTCDFSSQGTLLVTAGSPLIELGRTPRPVGPLATPFWFDLDQDGDQDLVATVGACARIVYQESLDRGELGPIRLLPLRETRMPRVNLRFLSNDNWQMTAGILEGDLLRQYTRRVGVPTDVQQLPIEIADGAEVILVEDLDASGESEVLVAARDKASLLLGCVRESVTGIRATSIPAEVPMGAVSLDVDQDGRRDVVVIRPQRGIIEWYRQRADLEFGPAVPIAVVPREPCLLVAEDIDGDAKPDLVVANTEGSVWFRWREPRGFDTAEPVTTSLQKISSVVPPLANVAIWNSASCQMLSTLRPIQHHLNRIALAPNGKTLASYGDDRLVRLRSCDTGDQIAYISLQNSNRVNSLEFSPCGEVLGIAHGDGCLLWDVATKSVAATLRGHESTVRQICFSPRGDLIATLSHDLTVGLWNTNTGEQEHVLFGFSDRPFCASFTPDAETIAIGTLDGKIVLWDVDTGQELFHAR